MIYKKMKKVVRLYEKYWDGAYFRAFDYMRIYLKNNNLYDIQNEDIERSISMFFKIWMKMMRIKWNNPQIINNIKETIRHLSHRFMKLRNKNLEKMELVIHASRHCWSGFFFRDFYHDSFCCEQHSSY